MNPGTRVESSTAPGDYFATTHWTVVLAAGQGSSPQSDQALEELCRTYWYPLYAYVRRKGHTREDAEDLTQEFFARFLGKNYLEAVRSEKGRFRAFLLASLKHFMVNEWRRANRQKRGGGVLTLSLNIDQAEERYRVDPADHISPDKLFDRAWAVTLLERVILQLREENSEPSKRKVFEALKPFLTQGKGAAPYAEASATLGISEETARVTVHRLRRRYSELLRREIAQTLADAGQVEEELRALFAAFGD